MSDERDRWIKLIKEIPIGHGFSLFEAQRFALSQPEWRRWVERQITQDEQCQRMARSHLRQHDDA